MSTDPEFLRAAQLGRCQGKASVAQLHLRFARLAYDAGDLDAAIEDMEKVNRLLDEILNVEDQPPTVAVEKWP